MVTSAEEDRISKLPDHLVDSILERVPFEDVVRTSILSKNWRYRWTTMKTMVFDEQFSKKYAKNGAFGHNGFIRIINQILILHEGPVLKFQLHIPKMFLDNFLEVDLWMKFLARKGVRELDITNTNPPYGLPSHLFSCQELRKLKLNNCIFKPPLQFQGFPNLEVLTLENIVFGENSNASRIILPRLKMLTLKACTDAYNFNIKAAKLQILYLISCSDAMLLLRLLDSLSLTSLHTLAVGFITFNNPTKHFELAKRIHLATLFSNLPKITTLVIDHHFLKFLIAENIPRLLPHAANNINLLGMLNFQLSDLNQLQGTLCLLRNSPNLERLCMVQGEFMKEQEVVPVSNQMPNCLDFTLNRLQIVEMGYIEGSVQELLFVKLLLAHSPSLEMLVIIPRVNSDAQRRYDLAKDVMRFPRASPKAQVIFLDHKKHQLTFFSFCSS